MRKRVLIACVLLLPAALRADGPEAYAPKKMFADSPVVGELSAEELKEYMGSIGVELWPGTPPWKHTEHSFGYLPAIPAGAQGKQTITPASRIKPDKTLKRIDIRLDRLKVEDYPGRGLHFVMFSFQATNEVKAGEPEDVTFNQLYRAQEGQGSGVAGYPVFVGLNVGPRGAAFKGATINVKNDGDEKALTFLDSGPVQAGLKLLTTAQPAIKPFATIATGLGTMLLAKNRNKKVQEFFVGLDFDEGAALGARLRAGSYVVVQAPLDKFQWADWVFDPPNVRIVAKKDGKTLIPYNHIIFRVTRHKAK